MAKVVAPADEHHGVIMSRRRKLPSTTAMVPTHSLAVQVHSEREDAAPPIHETAEVIRTMLRHETEQADRRVSWLTTVQGLLFTALAFAWDKPGALTTIVSVLGATVAVLVFAGMCAGTLAIDRLRRDWTRLIPRSYEENLPPSMGYYPHRAPWIVYASPENLLPIVFFGAWVWILVVRGPQ